MKNGASMLWITNQGVRGFDCLKSPGLTFDDWLLLPEAPMKSDYEVMLNVAAECELLAKFACDRSVREKSAELAREYRARAELLKKREAA